MQKLFEDKRWGLTLVFFALISLVLLAGTLRGLDFRPAQPIGSSGNSETAKFPKIGEIFVNAGEIPLWKQLVFWGGLFLIVVLISALLTPELRKRLLVMFLRLAAFMLFLFYFLKKNPDLFSSLLQRFSGLNQIGATPQNQEIAPPVFQPPQVPPFLSFLIAFGIILLAAFLFWAFSRWWAKQKELISSQKPLTEIAEIARASLKELTSGGDSNDAIIQCYQRMSHVVGAKRGLHREHAMTPAEFASRLERAGLPREPIVRLTRLFESARYGGHIPGQHETDEAVSCLTSILKYCGEVA